MAAPEEDRVGPGVMHRPVARARAEAYAALAVVFYPPTLCWCRGLRQVITTLGRVMLWYPQAQLAGQVHGLYRWRETPAGTASEEYVRLFGEAGPPALTAGLERMTDLCTREAEAWALRDEAAARDWLRQQRDLLQNLNQVLASATQAATEGVFGALLRTTWGYTALDERLVATLLMASRDHRAEGPRAVRAEG